MDPVASFLLVKRVSITLLRNYRKQDAAKQAGIIFPWENLRVIFVLPWEIWGGEKRVLTLKSPTEYKCCFFSISPE